MRTPSSRRAPSAPSRGGGAPRPSRSKANANPAAYRAIPGGRPAAPAGGRQAPRSRGNAPRSQGSFRAYGGRGGTQPRVTSVRVGDLNRAERMERTRETYRRHVVRIVVVLAALVALVLGGAILYFSDAFSIEEVHFDGVEHLTSAEVEALVDVPAGTTLLRVDAGAIKQSLLRDAWVESVEVQRVFPHTLNIVVTERTMAAVVEVSSQDATSTQEWALSSDGMWLMAIPSQSSALGQSISQKIYEDAESALHITDVPYGVSPETGAYCTDESINNALAIVTGMTTSLADQVVSVQATDAESVVLTLEDGVEIAFGDADDIRAKERVCLEIMEQNPGTVAYINVRVVESPTWRAL